MSDQRGDRGTETLAIGSGMLLCSLVESWQQAGSGKIRVLLTEDEPAVRLRLVELQGMASLSGVKEMDGFIVQMAEEFESWRETVRGFRTVLYAACSSKVAELRQIQAACRQEGAAFLPVVFVGGRGLAGPLTLPDDERDWESAWRQLHVSAVEERERMASPLGNIAELDSLLANIAVLSALQLRWAEAPEPILRGRIFLLDMETGEGDYHVFLPHPLVHGQSPLRWLKPDEIGNGVDEKSQNSDLLTAFTQLTSPVTGVFHQWDEGDLPQLPLSQCRITPIDPLSEGPAELLPEEIGAGLTHIEARREAGLLGLEAYAVRLVERLKLPDEAWPEDEAELLVLVISVGAGQSYAEAVSRGLVRSLNHELNRRLADPGFVIREAEIQSLDDERCQVYWEALEILRGVKPRIGLADLGGFPVAWVGFDNGGFASAGLNVTLALRSALSAALQYEQNGAEAHVQLPMAKRVEKPPMIDSSERMSVAQLGESTYEQLWMAAIRTLERDRIRLQLFDLGRSLLGGCLPIKIVGMVRGEGAFSDNYRNRSREGRVGSADRRPVVGVLPADPQR